MGCPAASRAHRATFQPKDLPYAPFAPPEPFRIRLPHQLVYLATPATSLKRMASRVATRVLLENTQQRNRQLARNVMREKHRQPKLPRSVFHALLDTLQTQLVYPAVLPALVEEWRLLHPFVKSVALENIKGWPLNQTAHNVLLDTSITQIARTVCLATLAFNPVQSTPSANHAIPDMQVFHKKYAKDAFQAKSLPDKTCRHASIARPDRILHKISRLACQRLQDPSAHCPNHTTLPLVCRELMHLPST